MDGARRCAGGVRERRAPRAGPVAPARTVSSHYGNLCGNSTSTNDLWPAASRTDTRKSNFAPPTGQKWSDDYHLYAATINATTIVRAHARAPARAPLAHARACTRLRARGRPTPLPRQAWFVDDVEIYSHRLGVIPTLFIPTWPMYMVLNVAMSWWGVPTPLPQTGWSTPTYMYVDYVATYQWAK